MIAYLTGSIQTKSETSLILDVNGVGYELFLSGRSMRELPNEGGSAAVHVHLHSREDLIQLFGFTSGAEKSLFRDLISVSGVGPKVAMSILSAFTVEALAKAVVNRDVDAITTVPGIGKKGAQRLVLELKERLAPGDGADLAGLEANSIYAEAKDALVALGYTAAESRKALEGFDYGVDSPVAADLIKFGLRNLSATA